MAVSNTQSSPTLALFTLNTKYRYKKFAVVMKHTSVIIFRYTDTGKTSAEWPLTPPTILLTPLKRKV